MRSNWFLPYAGICVILANSCFVAAGPVPSAKPTAFPDWWFERDVIVRLPAESSNLSPSWPTHYSLADDFAAANLGQLKMMASAAAAELDANLANGAGTAITSLISSWTNQPGSGVTRDDYSAINEGQLKTVADLYYARLIAEGYAGPPLATGLTRPWSSSASDDDAYALVNLGQLKQVFSFDPKLTETGPADTDSDGLPDEWEVTHFTLITAYGGSDDPDGDGLTNRAEFLLSINPNASPTTVSQSTLALVIFSP